MKDALKEIFKKVIILALREISKLVLRKHQPFVIGITGNVGKTSTKDLMLASLSHQGKRVRANDKSMNSEFGVPLTILNQKNAWYSILKWIKVVSLGISELWSKNYPEILILEVGADKKGDISSIASWVKFDVVVFTQIGEIPAHVENYKNIEEVIEEKSQMLSGLKDNGYIVYNKDSDNINKIIKDNAELIELLNAKLMTFGKRDKIKDLTNKEDDSITNVLRDRFVTDLCMEFDTLINDIWNKETNARIYIKDKESKLINKNIIGEASIYCSLPGVIVSQLLEMDLDKTLTNISEAKHTPSRMRVLDGINNSIVIDDSYNSSPTSLISGIKTINSIISNDRKIFVIGDMLELGEYARDAHFNVGKDIASSADLLLTVGTRAKFVAQGAIESGMDRKLIKEVDDARKAADILVKVIVPGDLIYVKGSQGMRLERVVRSLVDTEKVNPNDITRQERDWLNKK